MTVVKADRSLSCKDPLDLLLPYQRSYFEGIVRAMDGLSVTIRLLDPPQHEYLPESGLEQIVGDLTNPSVFLRIRRERSKSPRQRSKEGGMFKRLGSRWKSVSARSDSYNHHSHLRYTEALSKSEDSVGGHWKSRLKKKKSSREEDDLSQP
uniref:Pyruvate, phosphate dikinase, chloroplastic n=1 Tax=Tanacetum cinerariifolium TaxID=118510 RepID=A0A6L2NBZ9_TANCI|nr:pyruvate, phosphate dikinase, chloroplastic [Tanacetum cinerariifolium]